MAECGALQKFNKTHRIQRERERDFVRNDERDLWSSSLSPGGWLSIVRRRKRAASAQGCGKERRHRERQTERIRPDPGTRGDTAEKDTNADGGICGASLRTAPGFTRHCKLTLDLREPNRNLKTNGMLIIEKPFPTMQCTWPEPPFPMTHKVMIFISFLFSFCFIYSKHTVYELMNNTELPLTVINTDSMHYVPHQWCLLHYCKIPAEFLSKAPESLESWSVSLWTGSRARLIRRHQQKHDKSCISPLNVEQMVGIMTSFRIMTKRLKDWTVTASVTPKHNRTITRAATLRMGICARKHTFSQIKSKMSGEK